MGKYENHSRMNYRHTPWLSQWYVCMYGRDKRTYSQLFKLFYMEIEWSLFSYGMLQLGDVTTIITDKDPFSGEVLRMESLPFSLESSLGCLALTASLEQVNIFGNGIKKPHEMSFSNRVFKMFFRCEGNHLEAAFINLNIRCLKVTLSFVLIISLIFNWYRSSSTLMLKCYHCTAVSPFRVLIKFNEDSFDGITRRWWWDMFLKLKNAIR